MKGKHLPFRFSFYAHKTSMHQPFLKVACISKYQEFSSYEVSFLVFMIETNWTNIYGLHVSC